MEKIGWEIERDKDEKKEKKSVWRMWKFWYKEMNREGSNLGQKKLGEAGRLRTLKRSGTSGHAESNEWTVGQMERWVVGRGVGGHPGVISCSSMNNNIPRDDSSR